MRLPSGRRSFIPLTRDGPELPGTYAHLPDYTPAVAANLESQSELTVEERQRAFDSWLPRYSESTRMAWDEAVDSQMFVGSGWELQADLAGCTSYIDVLRRRTPELGAHFGPADAMISHSWENSFAAMDRAVQLYCEKKQLDPCKFMVWLDGFCIDKAAECTTDFLKTTFMKVIDGTGRMLSVLEPFEQPLPIFRAWCSYEMYCATLLPKDCWDVIHSPEESARMRRAVYMRPGTELTNYVKQVDIRQARAFRAEEEAMIKAQIESLPGGAEAVNGRIREMLSGWSAPFYKELYVGMYGDTNAATPPVIEADEETFVEALESVEDAVTADIAVEIAVALSEQIENPLRQQDSTFQEQKKKKRRRKKPRTSSLGESLTDELSTSDREQGRWTGSWSQTLSDGIIAGGEMALDLVMSGASGGRLTGRGVDPVGPFTMEGEGALHRCVVQLRTVPSTDTTYCPVQFRRPASMSRRSTLASTRSSTLAPARTAGTTLVSARRSGRRSQQPSSAGQLSADKVWVTSAHSNSWHPLRSRPRRKCISLW